MLFHRTVRLEGTSWSHLLQIPAHAGLATTARCPPMPRSISKDGDSRASDTLIVKKCFSWHSRVPPTFQFVPITSCPVTGHHWIQQWERNLQAKQLVSHPSAHCKPDYFLRQWPTPAAAALHILLINWRGNIPVPDIVCFTAAIVIEGNIAPRRDLFCVQEEWRTNKIRIQVTREAPAGKATTWGFESSQERLSSQLPAPILKSPQEYWEMHLPTASLTQTHISCTWLHWKNSEETAS